MKREIEEKKLLRGIIKHLTRTGLSDSAARKKVYLWKKNGRTPRQIAEKLFAGWARGVNEP